MDFQERAFEPAGKCILIAGATTAPTGTQLVVAGVNSSNVKQARFYNAGAVVAWVAFGDSGAAAAAAAIVPTGTSQNVTPILPGTSLVMSVPPNKFWSAITGSSTASIYVQPGRGL